MCAAGIRPSSLTRARDSFWWVSINSRLWFCWLLFHSFFVVVVVVVAFLFFFFSSFDCRRRRLWFWSFFLLFFRRLVYGGVFRLIDMSLFYGVLFFTEFFIFFLIFRSWFFFCYARRWGPWRRKMCRDSIFRPSSSFAYQSGLGGNQKGHRRRRLRLDPNDE